MRIRDVGVDLRGGNVGVAKEGLDGTEVGAVHKEVGGKGMAQSVWADMLGDAGHASVFFDDALDAARSETAEIAGSVDGLLVFAVI